jgi:hypothetical protein
MKRLLWAAPVALACMALLSGRADIRKFLQMRRM